VGFTAPLLHQVSYPKHILQSPASTRAGARAIVVEVKKDKIELDDVYQLKKYSDLFDARFSFLVSLKPIPAEIKQLCQVTFLLAKLKGGSIYRAFALAQFDANSKEFVEWFEENPFAEPTYWK
jgi:hypothetical protein